MLVFQKLPLRALARIRRQYTETPIKKLSVGINTVILGVSNLQSVLYKPYSLTTSLLCEPRHNKPYETLAICEYVCEYSRREFITVFSHDLNVKISEIRDSVMENLEYFSCFESGFSKLLKITKTRHSGIENFELTRNNIGL